MGDPPCLILFIDGLPYERLDECDYLSSLEGGPVEPGFGYSVNQQALLFSGLTPDDLRVFGEWNFKQDHAGDLLWSILSPLDRLRTTSPLIDRGIHYAFDRKLGFDCANIPFRALRFFTRNGSYPLTEAYAPETVMSRGGFRTIAHDFSPIPHGEKDQRAISDAKTALKNGQERIFISLPDIDGLAHKVGTSDPSYSQGLQDLNDRCRRIISYFRDHFPEGRVIVCSDHGMSDATHTVDLDIIDRFGYPRDGFVYFYDSVYFRAWFDKEKEEIQLRRLLEESNYGQLLSEAERQQYGLNARLHGDLIFVLNEGRSFAPNFFGLRQQAAYHGYHPDTLNQRAVFLSDGFIIPPTPDTLLEAHSEMETLLVDD